MHPSMDTRTSRLCETRYTVPKEPFPSCRCTLRQGNRECEDRESACLPSRYGRTSSAMHEALIMTVKDVAMAIENNRETILV